MGDATFIFNDPEITKYGVCILYNTRSRSASQAAVSAAMEDDWPEDDVETAGADAVVSQEEDDSEAMEAGSYN